jgi:hypothetical protein
MQDGIDSLQSARESSAAGAVRGKGGYSLSQKRVSPFKSPERKVYIASEQLEELQCLPIALPSRGVAAFGVARRFGLLLLSAAALPILWECTVVSVYRQSLQCGERSNAAFRKQSAAEKTSLAPHDSKARLQAVTTRRDSWRSHVHRTYIAQRVQFFKLQTANVRGQGARPLAFSWGIKRGPFSHVREWPPLTHPCTVQGNKNQRCRAVNPQTIGSSISLVAYAFSAQSARAPARYS